MTSASKILPQLFALALCSRVTTAHLIPADVPVPPPHPHPIPVHLPIHGVPVIAAPVHGAILAPGPPTVLVPYQGVPLKIFFTRFPPFLEGIVQRVQNYYSTYNHYPAIPPPEQDPVTTTSTAAPTTTITTTTTTTTTTTPQPTPASEDYDLPQGRYRYDPPVGNPFRYPKPGFQRFPPQDLYYHRS